LSGGENQRVSLARALVHRPRVLIADEPTGNLDPKATRDIMDLFLKMNEFGATVILVTHANDIVDDIGKRVIALEDGCVMRDEVNGKYFF
ncbi:MAG: ATP-binding cassette domain-containing protein, partial [Candidatus Moranbacteria bacterium]|nr:ATP-binding cassette domain-containing protein [Candidatus Moranbacteria bacterium]